ncbi:50S ribosomal protein L34e [Candidatus Woesearchaeota archaeon]|nr:50S ribosomal protein L34e [Candidatus Woesearchaeota archaeon]
MVSGRFKSRTFRRVFRRIPGGVAVLHHRRRKPGRAVCSGCGVPLKAVPRARPTLMRNLPKTAKRPERPYGGVLCSACMRKRIIARARS